MPDEYEVEDGNVKEFRFIKNGFIIITDIKYLYFRMDDKEMLNSIKRAVLKAEGEE